MKRLGRALPTAAALIALGLSAASWGAQSSPLDVGLRHYWNGEYDATVAALDGQCGQLDALGERIECYSYLGFSEIALGRDEPSRRAFMALLSLDPGYRLDPELVSPKILARFEDATQKLVDEWFDDAKASYARADYEGAIRTLDDVLALESDHELAQEYRRLCQERLTLEEKLAEATAAAAATPPSAEPRPLEGPPAEPPVYHIDSQIVRPVLVQRVEPVYPRAARLRRLEGSVVVALVIEATGAVRDLKIIRSAGVALDDAALEAVAQWRYRPATREGRPVAVHSLVQLRFELES